MLISAEGYQAVFSTGEGDGIGHDNRPLVCWQELDTGEVVGLFLSTTGKRRKLEIASSFQNFIGYMETDNKTVIPAQPGWYCRFHQDDDDPPFFDEPVIAWIVDNAGFGLTPITKPDVTGYSEPAILHPGGENDQQIELLREEDRGTPAAQLRPQDS